MFGNTRSSGMCTESVVTIASISLSRIRSIAGPQKSPCVHATRTRSAPPLPHRASSGHERGSSAYFIFEHEHVFAFDLTDHIGNFHLVIALALLVENCKGKPEPTEKIAFTLLLTKVQKRYGVRKIEILTEIVGNYRLREQMIGRHRKKPAYLLGMQVHKHKTHGSGRDQCIGEKSCGNGDARLVFLVASRVRVVRNNRSNPFCRSTSQCIYDYHELDKRLVGIRV